MKSVENKEKKNVLWRERYVLGVTILIEYWDLGLSWIDMYDGVRGWLWMLEVDVEEESGVV